MASLVDGQVSSIVQMEVESSSFSGVSGGLPKIRQVLGELHGIQNLLAMKLEQLKACRAEFFKKGQPSDVNKSLTYKEMAAAVNLEAS